MGLKQYIAAALRASRSQCRTYNGDIKHWVKKSSCYPLPKSANQFQHSRHFSLSAIARAEKWPDHDSANVQWDNDLVYSDSVVQPLGQDELSESEKQNARRVEEAPEPWIETEVWADLETKTGQDEWTESNHCSETGSTGLVQLTLGDVRQRVKRHRGGVQARDEQSMSHPAPGFATKFVLMKQALMDVTSALSNLRRYWANIDHERSGIIEDGPHYIPQARLQQRFWLWHEDHLASLIQRLVADGHRYERLLKWGHQVQNEMMTFDKHKFHYGSIFRLARQHSREVKLALEDVLNGPTPPSPEAFAQVPSNHRRLAPIIPRVLLFRSFYYGYCRADSELDSIQTLLPLEYWAIKEAERSWERTYHFLGTSLLRKCWSSLQAVLHHHHDQPLEASQRFNEHYSFVPHPIRDVNIHLRHLHDEIWPLAPFEQSFIARLREADSIFARRIRAETPFQGSDEEERKILGDYMQRQKILALANVVPGPITKDFIRLAQAAGWKPDLLWIQAPVDAPSLPATPNHNDDSSHNVAASATSPRIRKYLAGDGILFESKDVLTTPISVVYSPDTLFSLQTNPPSIREIRSETTSTPIHNPDCKGEHKTAVYTPELRSNDQDRAQRLLRWYSTDKITTSHLPLPNTVLRCIATDNDPIIWRDLDLVSADQPGHIGGGKHQEASTASMSTELSPFAEAAYVSEARRIPGENNLRNLLRTTGTTTAERHESKAGLPKPSHSTWQPSHGIAFQSTRRLSAPSVPTILQGDSTSDVEVASAVTDETDDYYQSLDFQIPEDKWAEALQATPGSPASYWSYEKYRSSTGEPVLLHYCKSKETSEKVAQFFVNETTIGCDIEWKSSAKETEGFKNNVSLIQIACEHRVALFHIALHKGTTVEEVLAPTLKRILESSDILKCGVSIKADFSRMSKHLGIETVSLFELSHLHRLVEFGVTNRRMVNRTLVKLSVQAEEHLGLPLYKGEERVSDWSQPLNMEQCKYAADDAYASYRIFEALKEKWYQLDPRPPFPAYAELGLPIQLAPLPDSQSSESEASESEANEVALLREQVKDAVISGTNKGDNSEDDYGESVFDQLTGDQLLQLENSLSQESKPEGQYVAYPTLSSELAIPEAQTFYVGRIGLQPRLRAMNVVRRRKDSTDPTPPSSTSSSESDMGAEEEEIEESKPDLQAISNANKDLYVEAAQWAEGVQKGPQESSSDPKITATPAALRAYYLWEHKQMEVVEIANLLRAKPLKPATVAAYISECLQFSNLEFSDRSRLHNLAKQLPRQARQRYWRIQKMAEEEG